MSGLCHTVWISPFLPPHPDSFHHQFLVPTLLFSYVLLLPIASYIQDSADTYQIYCYILNRKSTPNQY